jgi:2-dehydro-3-deoxyphosphooctonate aldolase (KDO 8-P synthase)
MTHVQVGDLMIGNDRPLTIIAGPCQLESADHARMIAGTMKEVCEAAGAQYVFKASFDKANRTSISGVRGPGIDEGLVMLDSVKREVGVPVLTDVHNVDQCSVVAPICDVLQIPALLCRQTDLILAAADTGAAINVKKGQFLAPWDMANIVTKIESTGNKRILLTERGTTFGYNALVTDMRSLPQMAATGYPVVMDATHSVQQPAGLGGATGGQREFAPLMARAAVAIGVACVFIETHQDPNQSPSDGPNMIYLDQMPALVDTLMALDRIAKANPLQI